MPTIQNRRATAAQWTAANSVLAAGEIGFELDTNSVKIGDGLTAWINLPYLSDESLSELVETGRLSESVLNTTYARVNVDPKEVVPEGFRGLSKLPTPRLIRGGGRTVTAEVDLDALRPPEGVTYFVSPNGSPTGAGTREDPSVLAAVVEKSDVGTVRLLPGEYFRHLVAGMSTTNKSINWIADGPGVRITGWNSPSSTIWTKQSGHIYVTDRSATYSIVDVQNLTDWGDFTVYEKKPDLASITGPGQWATDNVKVYVWCLGDTDLTDHTKRVQIRLQLSVEGAGIAATNTTHYAEGIDFWGCSVGKSSADGGLTSYRGSLVIAKDCTVKYNVNDNGAQTKGGDAIFVNVEASSNAMDGFNYHDTQWLGGEFIEIDCHSHHNGLPSVGATYTGTHNATTAHEGVTGIRVGGRYEFAAGPVVADVGSSHTWNIGCYSGGQGPGTSISEAQDNSWRISASGYEDNPATMWLDSCESALATSAYRSDDIGDIWVTNSVESNPSRVYSGTIVKKYEAVPSGISDVLEAVRSGSVVAPTTPTSMFPVDPPEDFTWRNSPLAGKLFVDQYGRFSTTLDSAAFKHIGGVTYHVDGVAGLDTNSGLSESSPLKTLNAAVDKPDVGTIRLMRGIYHRAASSNGRSYAKPLNIIGVAGQVILSQHDKLTWTLVSGKTYTYQSTRSGVSRVVDIAVGGRFGEELTQVDSIDKVEDIPGSWFIDGSTIYVRPATPRPADDSILALLTSINLENIGNHTLYLENIDLIGGHDNVRKDFGTLVMKNCGMAYSTGSSNALSARGAFAIMDGVVCHDAHTDGFNYHALDGIPPLAIEIGCHAERCGSGSSDQASTIHGGGKIIRVNGVYRDSAASNVTDVNAGTESWNLGCSNSGAATYGDWQAGDSARMWLDNCTGAESKYSIFVVSGAKVSIRGGRHDRISGEVDTY